MKPYGNQILTSIGIAPVSPYVDIIHLNRIVSRQHDSMSPKFWGRLDGWMVRAYVMELVRSVESRRNSI